MESRNPVFRNSDEFKRGGYATFDASSRGYEGSAGYPQGAPQDMSPEQLREMYAVPSAGPVQTGRMTLDDVVVRTATVFGLLLVSAALAWALVPVEAFGIVLIAALVGLVLGLVNSFRKEPSPALILAYAAVEGVVVGGFSHAMENAYDGVVAQAVLGTVCAFGAMLALYKVGAVRATPKFTRILIIAGVGYMAFGLIHLLGVLAGLWTSVYATGGLGLLLSAAGVVLASLYLVLDFDYIERGIAHGIPARFAWQAAFGLTVTIVWLYLELLRLLAILNRR